MLSREHEPRWPARRFVGWLAALCVCVGTGELFLRAAAAVWPRAATFVAHHRVPDERLGWRLNPEYPDVDDWGFRNSGVPQRADVVVLGDSQCYGYGVAPEDAWPRQLARRTGRSTYTVASSEFSALHGFVLWEHLARLRPAWVVAAVYAGNDLFDVFQLVYRHGQYPHLRSPDPETIAAVQALQAEQPLAAQARRITRMGRTPWPGRDLLRDHFRLYHLVRALSHRGRALGPRGVEADWQSLSERAARYPAYLQAFDGGPGRRTLFTIAKRRLPQDTGDARVAEGQRVLLAALEGMAARVESRGARLLILWIPTKESAFADAVADAGADAAPEGYASLLAVEERFRRRLQERTAALGLGFVDAGPALRASLAGGRHPYPVGDDGHPREAGYGAIADAVAAHLGDR